MKNITKLHLLLIAIILSVFISSCKNEDIILTPTAIGVGDYYEGGYIFYLDNTLKVGMVCAPTDQSSGISWSNGNYIATGATGTAVGTGSTNTTTIVNAQGAGNYAAKLCYDLVLNGYSDWFLPSKDELKLMYENLEKKGIADLSYGVYWSSSEYDYQSAWNQLYINGMQLFPYKNGQYDVRAVRAFTIVTSLPTLTTSTISTISSNTAKSGGVITSAGSAAVTARGICWSTTTSPTVSLTTKTSDGTGTGTFTSSLTGLLPATAYYVRAYATSSVGTAYGNEVTFQTTGSNIPTLTTTAISSIASNSAKSGGVITSAGSGIITARGVCWSTSTNPTASLTTKTSDGSGTGTFTSNLTGLVVSTTYYLRAYATTSVGTAYGNELNFKTLGANQVSDIDGNIYNTVTIGTQVWMKEDLKTTKYRDGSSIANTTDDAAWFALTTGAYCWYINDIANKATYGALYNFYAVVDSRNLCPTGWHIPSDAEWTTLTTNLGGLSAAGGKLKETGTTHWKTPNTGATNSSSFTALPGGTRVYVVSSGLFSGITENGNWWSSTVSGTTNALLRTVNYNSSNAASPNSAKTTGLSVRCIKD